MKKTSLLLPAIALSMFGIAGITPSAFAHEEVVVGEIKIVAGWVDEPPLVNQFNGIVIEITSNSTGEPITNAVAQLVAALQKGTLTKTLDFQPSEEPGVYIAEIIPTQTGDYQVDLRGTIAGQAIEGVQLEVELVDDTRPLEFPSRQTGDIPTQLIEQLEEVIADLNTQVEQANVASEEAVKSAQAATQSAEELRESADRAYLFGMVGVGVGVAGIIIGVISLSRRGNTV